MNPSPIMISDLVPGDWLIFSRKGIFETIIRVKTWSPATHVEVYIGSGNAVAARNGKQGCNTYSVNLSGLYCVLRPRLPFNIDKALAQFYKIDAGKPYGYVSLFSFCLIDIHDKGKFCSELATDFYRYGDFDPFNIRIKSAIVAPADALYIHESIMELIWSAIALPPTTTKT